MLPRILTALIALLLCPAAGRAAEICAWLVEANQPENVRSFDIWLQSDADMVFLYNVYGKGIITSSGEANAPANGTYNLRAGNAQQVWNYSPTFYPPGKIDITVEIHKVPSDYYSSGPTPLLASFTFARNIPASEKSPPPILATKQCMEIMTGE